MGRTKISAGRMAREPSVPKPIAVETSQATTTTTGSTPSSPSQPDRSPSHPPANRSSEANKNGPSSSPPSKPDTRNRANKPQAISPLNRTRPLTLRSGKKIVPPLTHVNRPRPLTLRSGKKIVPPLTCAQAKVGILDNILTVDDLPSSSDEPECEEVASNSYLSEPDSLEPEHTPAREKLPEPSAVKPSVADQPESSRRRAAPRDIVPAPKRMKAAMAMACGPPFLPPDYLPLSMQLRNRPKRDNAAKTKPKQEKTAEKKKKAQQQQRRIVDEATVDAGPVPSHSNGDISSLHTNMEFLTTVVLVNSLMLKKQQAQVNHVQSMVQTLLNRGL